MTTVRLALADDAGRHQDLPPVPASHPSCATGATPGALPGESHGPAARNNMVIERGSCSYIDRGTIMPAPLLPTGALPGKPHGLAVRGDRAADIPVGLATAGMATVPGMGADGVPGIVPDNAPGAAGGYGGTGDCAARAGIIVIDCNIVSYSSRNRGWNSGIIQGRLK